MDLIHPVTATGPRVQNRTQIGAPFARRSSLNTEARKAHFGIGQRRPGYPFPFSVNATAGQPKSSVRSCPSGTLNIYFSLLYRTLADKNRPFKSWLKADWRANYKASRSYPTGTFVSSD